MRAGRLVAAMGGVALVAVVSIGWWQRGSAPVDAVAEARLAMEEARRAGARRYAPDAYAVAEATWEHALRAWAAANEHWLGRDVRPVEEAAARAAAAARRAAVQAAGTRDSLAVQTRSASAEAAGLLEALRREARALPFDPDRARALDRITQRLAHAGAESERGDLWQAATHAQEALRLAARARRELEAHVASYLSQRPTWKAWADATVAWSRRTGRPAVVVDKMNRRCLLYVRGRLEAAFPVEFGPNWMGPKRFEGDLATPEGRYVVTERKGPGQTIYHRALEIDYPNETDRRRFEAGRTKKQLPPGARIGGRIELHGGGGRGADWTQGCVALTNADMEILFRRAGVGTPVTIVGALEQPPGAVAPGAVSTPQGPVRPVPD